MKPGAYDGESDLPYRKMKRNRGPRCPETISFSIGDHDWSYRCMGRLEKGATLCKPCQRRKEKEAKTAT